MGPKALDVKLLYLVTSTTFQGLSSMLRQWRWAILQPIMYVMRFVSCDRMLAIHRSVLCSRLCRAKFMRTWIFSMQCCSESESPRMCIVQNVDYSMRSVQIGNMRSIDVLTM